MKEAFNHSFSPEVQDLIIEIQQDHAVRESQKVLSAQAFARELDATVVGFWGHGTGNGGREYAVFKSNSDDKYFLVTGRNSHEMPIILDFDIYHTPNGLPVNFI